MASVEQVVTCDIVSLADSSVSEVAIAAPSIEPGTALRLLGRRTRGVSVAAKLHILDSQRVRSGVIIRNLEGNLLH